MPSTLLSEFQFTHPGRGATIRAFRSGLLEARFNSRTPGGVRRLSGAHCLTAYGFNSRTPGGVRRKVGGIFSVCDEFQFTHPGRGATKALLESTALLKFQFTHPGRGATFSKETNLSFALVSIHAPREGCDGSRLLVKNHHRGFNSRTPGGVRHDYDYIEGYVFSFNSRTPGGVRLVDSLAVVHPINRFQFTHPGRGATDEIIYLRTLKALFQFTHPGRGATGLRPQS